MLTRTLKISIPLLVACIGMLALRLWLSHNPTADLEPRVPGTDRRNAAAAAAVAKVDIGAQFQLLSPAVPATSGSWPGFRGEFSDNISRDPTPLAETWPAAGPPQLWQIKLLGEGHAGPAAVNGRVYLLDYDEAGRSDVLRCFAFADGTELWRRSYRVRVKRNHGMSRTVPAVTAKYVVSMGPRCHVMCVDAVSGDLRWGLDLVAQFDTKVPLWYTGQCPLIDDGVAVLAPGGKALMLGVDCATGQILWQTPNPNGWQMSHASIMPMTLGGRRMYVYTALGGMVGVAADGPDRGQVLWQTSEWNVSVIAPSPVIMPDGRIFVAAGYGAGSALFRVSPDAAGFKVVLEKRLPVQGGLASEQQTPIFYEGHLFGILPKDAGPLRQQFVCCTPDAIDTFAWTSGKSVRFGLGPYLLADGKFLILNEDGTLVLTRAAVAGYQPLAQAKVVDGPDAWGPMALVDGRLLLRDTRTLVCLDLRKDAPPQSTGPASQPGQPRTDPQ